jgi:hypothetical protein
MDDRQFRFVLFVDSSGTWFAAPPRFRNFLRDPIGVGDSRENAVAALLTNPELRGRAKGKGWNIPTLADFIEVDDLPGAKLESVVVSEPDLPNVKAAIRRQSFRVITDE